MHLGAEKVEGDGCLVDHHVVYLNNFNDYSGFYHDQDCEGEESFQSDMRPVAVYSNVKHSPRF